MKKLLKFMSLERPLTLKFCISDQGRVLTGFLFPIYPLKKKEKKKDS